MKNIGLRGFNKSLSDDRPGPGIYGSKYMEDAKAARSVLIKASSDAGPELAGRESLCGDGKPVGPDRSLEKGVGGFKNPWDRVPI